MNPQDITSADIAAWLQVQYAEARKLNTTDSYANIEVGYSGFNTVNGPAEFSVYFSAAHKAKGASFEECFEKLRRITPQSIAAEKREAAAKLLAEADDIETKSLNGAEPHSA